MNSCILLLLYFYYYYAQLDGLMNTERDELLERVAYLEKRTSDQAEELTCLKSALADCLRRVQLLESSRGTHSPTRRIAPRTASESRGNFTLFSII